MIAELYWANFLTAHEYLAASIDCASPMNASQPKVVVSRSRAGRLLQARTTKRKRMIKVRRCQNVSGRVNVNRFGRVNVNRFGHLKVNIRTCKSEHFSCVRTARSVAIKGRRPSATRPLRAKAMRAVPLPQGRCGINGRPPATRAPPIESSLSCAREPSRVPCSLLRVR